MSKIVSLCCELGICDQESIVPFFPKVRDRDDVAVLKCNKSGVILLSRSDYVDVRYYENKENFKYWGSRDRKNVILNTMEDNKMRYERLRHIICGKKWLDIGTGAGGVLDLLAPIASEAIAVEPQEDARRNLIDLGYKVYSCIEDVSEKCLDVVTMFHVFEHLINPIETLKTIKEMLDGGRIIIEVPHANDFLISFLDLDSFKSFTFWSEHLILHTRESLRIFLESAGFSNICIQSYQRFPLANHLYWLSKGMPGGHIHWNYLRTPELDSAYSNMLSKLDKTDTLIAIAQP